MKNVLPAIRTALKEGSTSEEYSTCDKNSIEGREYIMKNILPVIRTALKEGSTNEEYSTCDKNSIEGREYK